MHGDNLKTAALYLRASSEHQKYSTGHQEAALRDYAASNQFEIVRIYRDEGRSGLTLRGRHGLLKLLSDVQSGTFNFAAILVYDVSRWGRFQDADESAYYEYACRRAGIEVAYCAELFDNDGSPLAAILKSLKRAMAAEYSRELSIKVFRAQCRFAEAGFKAGGSAGYGLRRIVVAVDGKQHAVLEKGERKPFPSDRVTLARGPDDEVNVILRIYGMYVDRHMCDVSIARQLNMEGILNAHGRTWSAYHVRMVLTNEKYCGTIVFNRSTQKLKTSRRPNDETLWIRHRDAFEAVVTRERFELASCERRSRQKQWTRNEMLDGLRAILVEHGRVDAALINASLFPSAKSYEFRFRSLVAAMDAAGVSGASISRATITRFRTRCITKDMLLELERCAFVRGARVERLTRRTYLLDGVGVRLICTPCRFERSHKCWKVTLAHQPAVNFIIWVRLDIANEHAAQAYLLPVSAFPHNDFLWPSTRTLYKYERYAFLSIAHMFGIEKGSGTQ
jgi:DNA invertase Pin-like site-specific DNA recombinase